MIAGGVASAEEPNDSFAEATVLPSGVLSVVDELTPGFVFIPDTMLGVRGLFGGISIVDDDGSPAGDGTASAVYGAPTNSGSIDFVVSGYPDDFFIGDHNEFGEYEVFVDAYDFFWRSRRFI